MDARFEGWVFWKEEVMGSFSSWGKGFVEETCSEGGAGVLELFMDF